MFYVFTKKLIFKLCSFIIFSGGDSCGSRKLTATWSGIKWMGYICRWNWLAPGRYSPIPSKSCKYINNYLKSNHKAHDDQMNQNNGVAVQIFIWWIQKNLSSKLVAMVSWYWKMETEKARKTIEYWQRNIGF